LGLPWFASGSSQPHEMHIVDLLSSSENVAAVPLGYWYPRTISLSRRPRPMVTRYSSDGAVA
jgi:hypothetical protein